MRRFALLYAITPVALLLMAQPVAAPPVGYNLNYSDPANDVMVLYSTNGTPVLTGGSATFTNDHPEIDVIWIRTRDNGTSVLVHFEMRGDVVNLPNTTYTVNLYSDSTNQTHYSVSYTNGYLRLSSNSTGFTPQNITGNATVTSNCAVNTGRNNIICINIAKSLLGSITAWNVDGTAVMKGNATLGQPYSYQDFGWEVPGNPGSGPTVIEGHVYIEGGTEGISSATVSANLGGYRVVTNASGYFYLEVAPGTYNLTAAADGYHPQTKMLILGQGERMTHDFTLSPVPIYQTPLGLAIILGGGLGVAALLLLLFLKRRRRVAHGVGRETELPPAAVRGRPRG